MKKNFNDDRELKEAFKLFADKNGRIEANKLKLAMQSIEFEKRNPNIYKIIEDLDTQGYKDGVTYDIFVKYVNESLGNTNSKQGIEIMFKQLLEDPRDKTLTLNSLKKLVKDYGENIDPEELKEMFLKISGGNSDINFEEFYTILSRK